MQKKKKKEEKEKEKVGKKKNGKDGFGSILLNNLLLQFKKLLFHGKREKTKYSKTFFSYVLT